LYCLLTYWQEENVSKTHGNEWQVLDSVIILSLPPPPPRNSLTFFIMAGMGSNPANFFVFAESNSYDDH
jgi:hypothetical protein